MQIDYDPEADALYVHFREGEVDDTRQISKYIFVDEDEAGQPLGLEILFASRVLAGQDMTSVTVNIGRAAQAAA